MNKSARVQSQNKAFTLIELLVVIAIIAILMALLFPAFQSVKNSAYKATAANDVQQIATAVRAYYTDHNQYPMLDVQATAGQAGYDTVYGDPNGKYPNYELFNVLCCPTGWVDNQNASGPQNPQRTVYLTAPNVKNSAQPRSGISTSSKTIQSSNGDSIKQGDWVDPWGNEYVVFIDATYDGSVSSNGGGTLWFYFGTGNPNGGVVNQPVGVCSLGRDGTWGTNNNGNWIGSDDIVSWQ